MSYEEFRQWKRKKRRGEGAVVSNKEDRSDEEKESIEEEEEEESFEAFVLRQGRREGEGQKAVRVLEEHWCHSWDDWERIRGKQISGLPTMLIVLLDEEWERRTQLRKQREDPVYPLEHFEALARTDEEKLDCLIVRELKGYFEQGQRNKVLAKVFVNEISELSTNMQTVELDFGIQFFYLSEAHVDCQEGEPDYSKVWKPVVEFRNSIEMQPVVCVEEGGSFYIRDIYRHYGIVNWYQRYRGRVRVDLDLREFPFDVQTLSIMFGCTLWGADDVLLLDRTDPNLLPLFGRSMDSIHEFELVGGPRLSEQLVFEEEGQRDISFLKYEVTLKRKTAYYFSNVFVPVLLLMLLFIWQFLINPDTLNDRLQIAITCFLALVAFNFVVNETLPKVSHSTPLTRFFVLNYGLIALGAVESGIAFLVDVYLLQDGFQVAKILDWASMGSIALLLSLVMFRFVIMGKRGRAKQD